MRVRRCCCSPGPTMHMRLAAREMGGGITYLYILNRSVIARVFLRLVRGRWELGGRYSEHSLAARIGDMNPPDSD